MKNILLVLMLAFSATAFSAESKPASVPEITIKFEEGNFFAITQQFDSGLLDDFSEKILSYKKKELYIYFDTPGGSVIALSRMVRLMQGSDIKFTCIANFAASAGFMLFQHCDKRLLLSDGILMSHNWAGGFQDEAPRILTLFNVYQSLVSTIESVAIEKMNVDAKEYAALINNNLWMTSTLSIKYDAIDAVINRVSCSDDLIEERNPTTLRSFFGSTTIYKSGCPLIQKVYRKAPNKNKDIYLRLDKTLFEHAQKSYKMGTANWFYKGSKNFNE